MNWLRPLTSVLFVGAFLAVLYWIAYLPSQTRQSALRNEVSSLKADIVTLQARVAGLAGSGSELVFPKELMWTSESKADAELALQDAIVDLAGQFGITLITFGASGLTRDTAHDMIAIEIEAEGSLGQTYAFLAALEDFDPKTAVGILRMRPAQGYGIRSIEDVPIYSQITFWAFWGDAS